MDKNIEVRLNDVVLAATQTFNWQMTRGIEPYQTLFSCTHKEAAELYNQGKCKLTIVESDKNTKVEFENLWVLEHRQHPTIPGIAQVLVSDHRWLWDFPLFAKNFNDRRSYGFFRIGTSMNPVELQQVEAEASFLLQTTKDGKGTPYEAIDVIQAIFNQLLFFLNGPELELGVQFRFSPNFKDFQGVQFDNFDLRMTCGEAIHNLLQVLPQASVTLNAKGDILLNDMTDQSEEVVAALLGTELENGQLARRVSSKWNTPKKINCYFPRLIELKFTYTERTFDPTQTVVLGAPGDDLSGELSMQNVIIIPDEFIEVAERQIDGTIAPTRTFIRGEFCELESYLEALSDAPGINFRISLDLLRISETHFIDLYSALLQAGQVENSGPWKDRIAAISYAFRRLFRLNRRWVDCFAEIRDTRVAVVNAPFGSTAPSNVYSDRFYISGARAHYRDFQEQNESEKMGTRITCGSNVRGFNEILGSNTPPAPATVKIMHPDQGIIYIDWHLSSSRPYEKVVPGYLDNVPGLGVPGIETPITMDAVENSDEVPELEFGYKCSLILSVIPLAPNNKNMLHRVTVVPDQIQNKVTKNAYQNALEAAGPEIDVYLDNLELARIRWFDGIDDIYRQLFGLDKIEDDPILRGELPREDNIEQILQDYNLILNQTNNPEIGQAAALDRLAQAQAASIWSALTPHLVGGKTGRFNHKLVPVGWTDQVIHTINEGGFMTTTAVFPERLPRFNLRVYTDRKTQAVIDRLVPRR